MCHILGGKAEWQRTLVTCRRRLNDNIKMDLKEIGYDAEWILLTQDEGQ
jgi:hypothetical protein